MFLQVQYIVQNSFELDSAAENEQIGRFLKISVKTGQSLNCRDRAYCFGQN